jgi:predicted secreted protein
MPASEFGYVYWLHDDTCADIERHGYVGACTRLDIRLKAHRHYAGTHKGAVGVPVSDFKVTIIFTGPIRECRALEARLRPDHDIGWNRYPGGYASALGHKHTKIFRKRAAVHAAERFKGIPKSPEWRAAMSAAAKARYTDPTERERMSKAVKKGLRGIDRSGTNNSMFGRKMSEATKEKIRAKIKERGGVDGANNPNYRHGRYSDT